MARKQALHRLVNSADTVLVCLQALGEALRHQLVQHLLIVMLFSTNTENYNTETFPRNKTATLTAALLTWSQKAVRFKSEPCVLTVMKSGGLVGTGSRD